MAQSRMIRLPKRLAFFWGGGPFPPLRAASVRSAVRLNPDWDVRLYLDRSPYEAGSLNREHFADSYSGEDHLFTTGATVHQWEPPTTFSSPVQASDFFRWQWLAEGGGVYADTDIVFTKSLGYLPTTVSDTTYLMCDVGGNMTIGILAATAESTVFDSVLEECWRRVHLGRAVLDGDRQILGVLALARVLLGSPAKVSEPVGAWISEEYAFVHAGWSALQGLSVQAPVVRDELRGRKVAMWPPLIYRCSGHEVALLDAPLPKLEGGIGIHWFGGHPKLQRMIASGEVPAGLRPHLKDLL